MRTPKVARSLKVRDNTARNPEVAQGRGFGTRDSRWKGQPNHQSQITIPTDGTRWVSEERQPVLPQEPTSLLNLIGNTPLLELSRIRKAYPGVKLLAKAEWFNPGGSVKDRAAASIIAAAEAKGQIRKGIRLLDASSGNTAVAYAMIAAVKGYPLTLCVPKNANAQVLGLLRRYGAEVILTDPLQGSDGAIRKAKGLAESVPEKFLYLDQYSNPANWQAHYHSTAVEIWQQTQGQVTHFVAGLGTTGTLIGTSRRLKEFNPRILSIAVQPATPLHGLEGLKHLASAIVPGIYDPAVPDETLFVSTEQAYAMVRRLAFEEGMVIGPSAGAALAASVILAERMAASKQKAVIVLIFPDSGNRYLTEGLFDELPSSVSTVVSKAHY